MGLILYRTHLSPSSSACLSRAPFRDQFPDQIDGRYWPAQRFDPSGSNRQEDMAVDRCPAAITSWRRGSVEWLAGSIPVLHEYIYLSIASLPGRPQIQEEQVYQAGQNQLPKCSCL